MTTFRSIFYLVFMFATVILYALVISVCRWIVPYTTIAKMGNHWGQLNLLALKYICGLTYQIHGKENLPSNNCIILCKHQSVWETIALRALLPPEQTWVLKRELLWTPFFGWALAAYRPIAIDRRSALHAIKKLLHEGKYWLEKGRWVIIFPEGTRVAPEQRKRYAPGGAILAQKSGFLVIPVAHNAGVFWRRRSIKKYAGKIDLVIGEALDPSGLGAAEINRRIENWIERTVAKLPRRGA